MIERKAYVCEHCNKHRKMKKTVYLTRSVAWYHEYSCIYNPENRTCCTCKHNSFSQGINNCSIGKGLSEKQQNLLWSPGQGVTRNCEHWKARERDD